ncbi:hypothetical protein PPERSA_07607 [Pseudocohnilembus persalinus]|uniref:Uncharacterized protein n=1 Tax=Pseudocohnilembus persalinus TaxID=266149 RepID=A0A0V0QIN7_PSEPJ|nr:hypothetical protein PPERSA_07607 [Pseudocohnilembus persalinus]|eukprot:KRX01962.1 hypothetical protein PPERSA_07607 [Pseudocohnilembus persalinus]
MQYNQRINMLQEELRQDRMMKDTSMRMQSKEDHKYVNIDETTGLISSNQYGAVLKNRCQEISAANKYKQELINQYTKNGRVLSDCFEKMKVMSGIFDIEEVAKLYIQSEGQNRQLQNFVYEVEAEIREKREIERQQLKKINKLIQQNEQMKQMKESGNQADQISYLQEKIQEKQESAIQGQENMNKITSCYMNLAKQLVNSKFNVKGENKVFPEDLQLNHTNITFFLSEIDQFNGLNNLIKEKDNIPTEGVDREYLEK